jgi:hypothetical protein
MNEPLVSVLNSIIPGIVTMDIVNPLKLVFPSKQRPVSLAPSYNEDSVFILVLCLIVLY